MTKKISIGSRKDRKDYHQHLEAIENYMNLWHSACEDVARLRAEKDKYHALFLDGKDQAFAHRRKKEL